MLINGFLFTAALGVGDISPFNFIKKKIFFLAVPQRLWDLSSPTED